MSTQKNKEDFSAFDGGLLNGGSLAGVSVDTIKAYTDATNSINKTRSDLRINEAKELSSLQRDDADERELRRLEADRAAAPRLTNMQGPLPANSRERAAIMAQRRAAVWTSAKESHYRALRHRLGYDSPEGEAEDMRHDRAREIYNNSEYIRTDGGGHWKRYWDSVKAKRNAQTEQQKAKDALWDRRLETVFGSDYVADLQKTPGAAKQAREDLMNVSKYYHDNSKGLGDLIDAYVHDSHGSFDKLDEDTKRLIGTVVPNLIGKDDKGNPTSYNMDSRTDMEVVKNLSPEDKYKLTKIIMQFHRENPQALRNWQQLPKENISSARPPANLRGLLRGGRVVNPGATTSVNSARKNLSRPQITKIADAVMKRHWRV